MVSGERSRRRFLRRTAAVAFAASIAGCGGEDPERTETATPTDDEPTATPGETETPSPTATETPVPEIVQRYGDRFSSIVSLADLGFDGSRERIDDAVSSAIADDSLLYFPSGTYRLGRLRVEGRSNFGFASLPDDDVTIVPAEPATEIDHQFLEFRGVSDFVLEGITFDYRDDGVGGVVKVLAEGDFVARDLEIKGKMPDRMLPDHPVAFRFDQLEESASGLVENVVAKDGGHMGGNAVGIYVGKDHAGELTFKDCVIENFPDNGLYASAPGRQLDGFTGNDGTIHVRGGRYANNNISNVRIGSTDSTVKDVTIVVDEVPPHPEESSLNVRGLRLRGRSGQVVENCEIVVGADAAKGFGAIVVHPTSGEATIRDTEITVDLDDYRAIRAFAPRDVEGSPGLTFENVTVSGEADRGDAVRIRGRDGTAFRDCVIEQTGSDRHGLTLIDTSDCVIEDTTIRVTGAPIRTNDASVERQNLTTESWTRTNETE